MHLLTIFGLLLLLVAGGFILWQRKRDGKGWGSGSGESGPCPAGQALDVDGICEPLCGQVPGGCPSPFFCSPATTPNTCYYGAYENCDECLKARTQILGEDPALACSKCKQFCATYQDFCTCNC